MLAITHYSRLLHELRADHVHVLSDGVHPALRRPRAGRRARAHRLRGRGADRRARRASTDPFADPLGLTARYSPVAPSIASLRRSAWPLCRAVSSIMWQRIQRSVNDLTGWLAGDGELVERVAAATTARLRSQAST